MVAWDKAQKPQYPDKKDVERLVMPIGSTKIRLVGELLPRFVYWVTTTEGKKAPVECLKFNRETEQFIDTEKDPMQEVSKEIFSDSPQFAYVCNVIDRKDGKIKLFDLKASIYKQILEFAAKESYGNPADEKNGWDIEIKKEKTGPLPQNVKYSVIPDRGNSPLTEEEKKLDRFDLPQLMKRQTYVEQKQWLLNNTSYFAGEVGDEFKTETPEDLS